MNGTKAFISGGKLFRCLCGHGAAAVMTMAPRAFPPSMVEDGTEGPELWRPMEDKNGLAQAQPTSPGPIRQLRHCAALNNLAG